MQLTDRAYARRVAAKTAVDLPESSHAVPARIPTAAIIVAAFFWYPLAPTAAILALVLIINLVWLA